MNYRVEATPYFVKEFKRLKKKYPSLDRDLSPLIEPWKAILNGAPRSGEIVLSNSVNKTVFITYSSRDKPIYYR